MTAAAALHGAPPFLVPGASRLRALAPRLVREWTVSPRRAPVTLELLALLSIACSLVVPPAAWPDLSWLADGALALAAVAVGAAAGRSAPRPGPLLGVLAALLVAGHLGAEEIPSSWAALAQAARIGLGVVLGTCLARRAGAAERAVRGLAALAVVLTLVSAWQVLVSHPAWLDRLAPTGAGLRAQLGDDRANGPFLLPGHLGAFASACAPAALALLLGAGALRPPWRWLAGGAASLGALATVELAGSQSATILLGAGVALFAVLALPPRPAAAVAVAGLVVSLALGLEAREQRSAEIAGEAPSAARSLNWITAMRLVAEEPVLGHGGGGFAVGSPRVRPAAANDAVRAHQGLLEIAVEHGLAAALCVVALLGSLVRRALRATLPRERGAAVPLEHAALVAGAGVLVAHSLVDFGWSDPGWAVVAAIVVGTVHGLGAAPVATPTAPDRTAVRDGVGPRGALGWPRRWTPAVAVAALVAVLLPTSLVGSLSAVRLREGRAHLEAGRAAAAWRAHRAASRIDPFDSRAWAGASQASLALGETERAVAEARRAVETAPRRAAPRGIEADALAVAGRGWEALVAAARAAQLAPFEERHRERRDRLLEAVGERR